MDKYRTNIDPAKYMTAEEAAEYCDAETDTMWEFVEDGILDAYHTEYGIRFPKKDVREACRNDDEGGKPEVPMD